MRRTPCAISPALATQDSASGVRRWRASWSVSATIPSGQLVGVSFDEGITLDPFAVGDEFPEFFSDGASELLMQQGGISIVNTSSAVVHAKMNINVDASGLSTLTGLAQVPAGGTVTITINGGSPITLPNGKFSIPA